MTLKLLSGILLVDYCDFWYLSRYLLRFFNIFYLLDFGNTAPFTKYKNDIFRDAFYGKSAHEKLSRKCVRVFSCLRDRSFSCCLIHYICSV